MSHSKGKKQEIKEYAIQEKVPLYVNSDENKYLSGYIRNSLTRLDMLIFLDRKEDAQAEIQEISQQLKKMGI